VDTTEFHLDAKTKLPWMKDLSQYVSFHHCLWLLTILDLNKDGGQMISVDRFLDISGVYRQKQIPVALEWRQLQWSVFPEQCKDEIQKLLPIFR